ncbi:MAG: nuclear transport factor 2 family protein [SAR86 cluster bacterium]|jgi:hypothetical protein|uniref:Nuclear transport factor 2 family protein n=1 Tax=SAR86 cluster bacterium TaxID=2030880 RepID=A0A972VZP2_9GAMM|nr:nuclear transport factor 2 family protein [SAR86 cluster bacterium]|tara:strand:- start:15139 stop:15594 length:456 start_codon:yes stop_codon:yes gene_type:complete
MIDLQAIELIKQLKARYFRFLDTGDFAGLQTVFTEDAKAHFKGGDYEFNLEGWPALHKFYVRSITPTKFGMHHGHHPEISVDGDHATGIWYLQDVFYNLDDNTTLSGTALYDDQYLLTADGWKISYSGYRRLFEEIQPRNETSRITVKPIN